MAPLVPFWAQPSHPDIQKVLVNKEQEYTTKSISLVDLPPYALYAKFAFPPCTAAEKPTYATVQMGKDKHLNLNSDLVYINHSCEPSVIFDMASLSVISGPNGLKKGDELTFFYPSTEWDMAQGFDCFCGAQTCRGFISGAKNMAQEQLQGNWLNAHIRALLDERDGVVVSSNVENLAQNGNANGGFEEMKDATEQALQIALTQAKKVVDAAQRALDVYKSLYGREEATGQNGSAAQEVGAGYQVDGGINGGKRRGVTSRELSGEMGGDTKQ
ncbi:putative galactose-proton symport [Mollisia scopiformis]|uniref:Putative galactose-proton symport n=1 Tax=Mollisia scopiformis TaxID=149040 RepID=A0A194WZW4_MOLSC|nr:putative galactose-proton symport [Mollisia scopiformis]KUJ13157.1 putative galactose-proton symport [Mollisia scopiformis]